MSTVRFVLRLIVALGVLSFCGSAAAARGVPRIQVEGDRVFLHHIVPGAAAKLAQVDLGPVPAPGGSRIIDRKTMREALDREQIVGIKRLPKVVRIVRKMQRLSTEQVKALARKAIMDQGVRRGIRLIAVKPPRSLKVAKGWDQVSVRLPKPPRRQGTWSTTALITLSSAGKRLARLPVPVRFDISKLGATPDVRKGESVILVVRRGLVELKVKGVVATAGDIGDTVSVGLRPSGKRVRARLLAGRRALALGGSQ